MKLSNEYLLRTIDQRHVLIPVGQAIVDYKHMILLNDIGYHIVKNLLVDIDESDLIPQVIADLNEYDNNIEHTEVFVHEFLYELKKRKIIDE